MKTKGCPSLAVPAECLSSKHKFCLQCESLPWPHLPTACSLLPRRPSLTVFPSPLKLVLAWGTVSWNGSEGWRGGHTRLAQQPLQPETLSLPPDHTRHRAYAGQPDVAVWATSVTPWRGCSGRRCPQKSVRDPTFCSWDSNGDKGSAGQAPVCSLSPMGRLESDSRKARPHLCVPVGEEPGHAGPRGEAAPRTGFCYTTRRPQHRREPHVCPDTPLLPGLSLTDRVPRLSPTKGTSRWVFWAGGGEDLRRVAQAPSVPRKAVGGSRPGPGWERPVRWPELVLHAPTG